MNDRSSRPELNVTDVSTPGGFVEAIPTQSGTSSSTSGAPRTTETIRASKISGSVTVRLIPVGRVQRKSDTSG